MQYKTIVLELLEQRPKHYEELRSQRKVLETLDRYAREFRDSHLEWQKTLPDDQAFEMALKELEERLPPE